MDQTTNVVQLRPARSLGDIAADLKRYTDELRVAIDAALSESLEPGQLDPRD